MTIYGPAWPLKKGENDVFELYTKTSQQAAFELKNLILTNPGENLSDFNYGVGLRRFLFDQNSRSTRSLIENRIVSQVSRYISLVTLIEVRVVSDSDMIDSGETRIKIRYSVAGELEVQDLEIDFSNNQGGLFQ